MVRKIRKSSSLSRFASNARKATASAPVVKAINSEKKAIVRAVKRADDSLIYMNYGKNPIVRVKKSIIIGSYVDNLASGVLGRAMIFDPAGTAAGTTFPAIAGGDFANFSAVFKWYKVTAIRVKHTFVDTSTGEFKLLVKRDSEYGAATPTPTLLAQQDRITQKVFSDSHNTFSYSVKPMILDVSGTVGGTYNVSRMVKMPWVICSSPMPIYGAKMCSFIALTATQTLTTDVEYDISFKASF